MTDEEPCLSVHPEYPQFVCEDSGTHKSHRCWTGSAWALWENQSYVPLPKPTKRKDSRKALADYYESTKP